VGHVREALLFLGQSAFNDNYVMEIISSVSRATWNTE
jgi:hypothetical protein